MKTRDTLAFRAEAHQIDIRQLAAFGVGASEDDSLIERHENSLTRVAQAQQHGIVDGNLCSAAFGLRAGARIIDRTVQGGRQRLVVGIWGKDS
jgi:hypothetical protein